MVEVYYNSWSVLAYTGIFGTVLKRMLLLFTRNWVLFMRKKVTVRSRIPGCGVMRYFLEYLQEETDVPTEVAAQKMLYDLYLREKLKKRPVFAPDQKQYETAVWNYRKNNQVSKNSTY